MSMKTVNELLRTLEVWPEQCCDKTDKLLSSPQNKFPHPPTEDAACRNMSNSTSFTSFPPLSPTQTSAFSMLCSEMNQMEFSSSSYASDLLSSLQLLFAERLFCDVVLCIESSRFHAHKTVLGAASPYFKAMFLSGMTGGGGGDEEMESGTCAGGDDGLAVGEDSKRRSSSFSEIELRMTNPDIFCAILDYLYTGKISINEENVQASRKYCCGLKCELSYRLCPST